MVARVAGPGRNKPQNIAVRSGLKTKLRKPNGGWPTSDHPKIIGCPGLASETWDS
jgi:hypothetical protein